MLYRSDGWPNGYLNGWARFLGLVGVPGAISIYLVWWLTQWLGLPSGWLRQKPRSGSIATQNPPMKRARVSTDQVSTYSV